MREARGFRVFNQFGYRRDAFDTYRDAIDRSNRRALGVLSRLGLILSVVALLFVLPMPRREAGMAVCVALMGCCIAGILERRIVSHRPVYTLGAAYLICVCLYALAIYGTVTKRTNAFWIAAQMGLCGFFLDYAIRMLSLQAGGFVALQIARLATHTGVSDEMLLYETVFLALACVTYYTLGRAKLELILSREETRQQADTDLLTGLLIRNAAQEEIEQDLAGEESGVMMLLDLDRFKSVNDQLGHQKGDQVLIDVAADLRRMFRNTDILSRLGGDEFIIFMRGVPEQDWALQRAEQVVREVRRWVSDGTTNIQISASVGVVMTETAGRDYTDLYRAADIAMYFAKARGGNQAILYTPELMDRAPAEAPATTRGDAKTLAEHNETEALR